MVHYLFLFHWLPYFDRLWFPYRVLGFSFVAIALWAGVQARAYDGKYRLLVLSLIGVSIGLVENYTWQSVPVQSKSVQLSSAVSCIKDKVIELPIGFVRQTLIWQTIHEQQTFGGMGENGLVFLPSKARE